ncbi:hypothetical protein CEP54_006013 [Fusarium duplospermum]|uniref:Uncharacterized protein n=1 Tax=Fusarium duplospermum TaxID=1325734 RepID=A0A428Q9G5_9HYPO|nr:hypothetical protein CEP54_006013 [Fusarium duplospermum]
MEFKTEPVKTEPFKADDLSVPGLGSQDVEVVDLVWEDGELPSVSSLQLRAKRARTRSATSPPPSKRKTLNNHDASTSSSSNQSAAPSSRATTSFASPFTNTANTSAITRATPKWPLPNKRTSWLKEIKGVYDVNPTQFYRHIDNWFEDFVTKVRLGRIDDYSNRITLNYGESRCLTGIFHAFPNANLSE